MWSVCDVPLHVESAKAAEDARKKYNCWTEPSADRFNVRTLSYLLNRLKSPSRSSLYKCIGMNVFKRSTNMFPSTDHVEHLKQFLKSPERKTQTPEGIPPYLVICWQFHNFFRTEYWCAVQLFELRDGLEKDVPAMNCMKRFVEATDSEKRKKLKFMALIREASPAIKKSISLLGGEKPCIIGKKLHTDFKQGSNFLEVDMDVGSSHIASSLNGVVARASKSLVVDKAWLIEGQAADELPERVLCCCEWWHCGLDDISIALDKKGVVKKKSLRQLLSLVSFTEDDTPKRPDVVSNQENAPNDEQGDDEEEDVEFYDTYTTINDSQFLPQDGKRYKYKKSELTALQQLGRKVSMMDITTSPIEGKFEGTLELKSYEPGRHKWRRRKFTLTWSKDTAAELSYITEGDAFNHTLKLRPSVRIESRNTFFDGTFAFALIDETDSGPETKALLRSKSADELHNWLKNLAAALTAYERSCSMGSMGALEEQPMLDPALVQNAMKRRSRRNSKSLLKFDWLKSPKAKDQEKA